MTNHASADPVLPAASPFQTAPIPVSNATRHLCVGAYLDEDFQRASLNEVYHQRRRLVAPSYGFDLVAVLGQCLQARRLAVVRDATIVVVLVLALCAVPLAVTFVIALLLSLYLYTTTWRAVRDTARELRRGRSASAGLIAGRAVMLVVRIVAVTALSFVLTAVTTTFAAFGIAASLENGDTSDPLASLPLALAPSATVGLLVFTLGTSIAANLYRQSQLEQFTPGRTPPVPAHSERFDEIRQQESGNTVIFAGYRPFVGSGVVLKNWGFAQRLVRAGDPLTGLSPEADREFETAPFGAVELVAHLRDELGRLAAEREPERQLPGLTVDDRVFLAGTEVARLVPHTDPAHLPAIVRHPTAPLRHYLVCQVVSWRGELVTTVYVHVAVQGRSLYVEFTSTALPPCDERYRMVDQVGGTGLAAYLRAGLRGLADAPSVVGRAPLNLIRAGLDAVANSSSSSSGGPTRLGYDYGARVSIRELGMAADTRHHLQTQEVDKHQRIIERRLLAAVLDFLEDKGVDTSEYRQRAATLLNAGAIVTGGNLTVQGDVNSNQTYRQPGEGPGR